jgi:hypothetical protein
MTVSVAPAAADPSRTAAAAAARPGCITGGSYSTLLSNARADTAYPSLLAIL